jgi:ABC-type multidrug transport system fused ATPase/permease subunit
MDREPIVFPDIISLIGNTPLLRLNSVTAGLQSTVVGKMEMLSPGGSVKDRIGFRMLDEAESRGWLKSGGTIVEPTSGNTGVGLAIVGVRAFATSRGLFRYAERLASHDAALRALATLRGRVYDALVPLAPAGLPSFRSSDLLSRMVADVAEEEDARRRFLDDLLHGRGDDGDLAARAERFGLRMAGDHLVTLARAEEPFADGDPLMRRVEHALTARFGARNVLLSIREGLLICVTPASLTSVSGEFTHHVRMTVTVQFGSHQLLVRDHPTLTKLLHPTIEVREVQPLKGITTPEPQRLAQQLHATLRIGPG